ncbi:magnesium-dependent phosphatase 1-like [Vigna umbellata]|uniref:magnesium-dependent phosphatase 1-like n=1 Tax=Vigna umbellata TaxID=87088 RepID=UPI001F5EA3E5|nr:magnesium-dependent phosphatase 1-like [Vigna umbellata]XP_047182781.1 magnesium-dependent phosphatase 1-like [Vigna umbellata]
MEEKTEKVNGEALQIIEAFEILPKLVVFDLDYTLWPFYCECRSKHEMRSLCPHTKGILLALKEKGIDVAIASRSPTANLTTVFLNKLVLSSLFVAQLQLKHCEDVGESGRV